MSKETIDTLVEDLVLSTESNKCPYEGLDFKQEDYDDGMQTLYVTQGDKTWQEKRFYPHDTPNFEVVGILMDGNVDRPTIYKVITKLSELKETTKPE